MGSADPLDKWMKKIKSENMQKEQFSEWGLTTYLFRYTSKCTIS